MKICRKSAINERKLAKIDDFSDVTEIDDFGKMDFAKIANSMPAQLNFDAPILAEKISIMHALLKELLRLVHRHVKHIIADPDERSEKRSSLHSSGSAMICDDAICDDMPVDWCH